MRERVAAIPGRQPVLFVAPYGPEHPYTDTLAETAANQVGGSALINRGFQKADQVDVNKDLADCNRLDHLKQPVISDEFLKPLRKFRDRFAKHLRRPLILIIMGCSDSVKFHSGKDVETIVGWGKGDQKDSPSCALWRKSLFVDMYQLAGNDEVYEGKGCYAGRESNELNQFFRKHEKDWETDSLLLTYPTSERHSKLRADLTAVELAMAVEYVLEHDTYLVEKRPVFI